MDSVLEGESGAVVERGALGLATDALGLIEAIGAERDLSALPVRWPRLGVLLHNQEQLAELPSEPPPGTDA
ncbi:hypothetical protein ACLQ24_25055 [Micromonospora sp. DT4]|uniref:hypothetical protein n=1 Tax=Micromonospora sp. DT4 TaxID=3393438 RepID=UPI003CEA61DE